MKTLVLDAMGVIYEAGDDVAEFLCPFIHENGGITDDSRIEALYKDASLGRLSAGQFWEKVRVDPSLEDAYLGRHRLSAGLLEFLHSTKSQFVSIWCLSNDVSEWSRKLRKRFDLSRYFDGFVISAEVGARKPDKAIFKHLLMQADIKPGDAVFVDDRSRNLDTAENLGFKTVLFGSSAKETLRHHAVANFAGLREYICYKDGV